MEDQILALVGRHLPSQLRPSGNGNFSTKCPFHKGGEERTPSFSVNPQKGLFNCFTCHEAGDIKRLLVLLGLPRDQVDREVQPIAPILQRNREQYKLEQKHFFSNRDPFRADYSLPESFLGIYDWMPLKLVKDGFDSALLKSLDIGFDKENNRITYPLRDMYGNLAGFSGGATLPGQEPKYKVYQGGRTVGRKRVHADFGAWFDEKHPDYRCENHDFLWNFNRVFARISATSDSSDTVFVVEGFKACMWMIQAGFLNTVALMGSYISERQQRMLHMLGGHVCLFLDNDEAGRRATFNVGDLLWRPLYGRIDVVMYPEADVTASLERRENTQPDDYELDAVRQLVQQRQTFVNYFQYLRSNGRWHQ